MHAGSHSTINIIISYENVVERSDEAILAVTFLEQCGLKLMENPSLPLWLLVRSVSYILTVHVRYKKKKRSIVEDIDHKGLVKEGRFFYETGL